jgi:hypothetical protein
MGQFLIGVVVFASISSEAQDTTQTVAKGSLSAGGSRNSMYKMIGGGIAVGAIGLVVGWAMGGGICEYDSRGDDDDGLHCLAMAVLGAAIGESVGVALGVHAGNGSRGRLGVDAIASIASLYGVVVFLNALELDQDSKPEAFILGTSGQLAAVIATERAFGRHQKERKVEVSLRPYQGGKRKCILTVLSFPFGL